MTFHATTILAIKDESSGIIIGDGQVSLGNTVMKGNARKVKRIGNGKVISGFAGATADAFTLFERIEKKLEKHQNQLMRSCLELAKDWRSDKYLRKLEAMMIVMDYEKVLVLSGSGDVIEPEGNITAIGSGGVYALSAARALRKQCPQMPLRDVAVASMEIAAEICVFTNNNFVIEEIKA